MMGRRCEDKLSRVNPDLALVVHRAWEISPIKFIVSEGLRSRERQAELYAQGRTAPGKKVTWTMDSKHLYGLAVDLAPLYEGKADYGRRAMLTVGRAMMQAAAELGVPLRWGWDWDRDGALQEAGETDGPHFELIEKGKS